MQRAQAFQPGRALAGEASVGRSPVVLELCQQRDRRRSRPGVGVTTVCRDDLGVRARPIEEVESFESDSELRAAYRQREQTDAVQQRPERALANRKGLSVERRQRRVDGSAYAFVASVHVVLGEDVGARGLSNDVLGLFGLALEEIEVVGEKTGRPLRPEQVVYGQPHPFRVRRVRCGGRGNGEERDPDGDDEGGTYPSAQAANGSDSRRGVILSRAVRPQISTGRPAPPGRDRQVQDPRMAMRDQAGPCREDFGTSAALRTPSVATDPLPRHWGRTPARQRGSGDWLRGPVDVVGSRDYFRRYRIQPAPASPTRPDPRSHSVPGSGSSSTSPKALA